MVLDGSPVAYREIAAAIEDIPGVVAHGLIEHPRVTAVVAGASGPQILQQVRQHAASAMLCSALRDSFTLGLTPAPLGAWRLFTSGRALACTASVAFASGCWLQACWLRCIDGTGIKQAG